MSVKCKLSLMVSKLPLTYSKLINIRSRLKRVLLICVMKQVSITQSVPTFQHSMLYIRLTRSVGTSLSTDSSCFEIFSNDLTKYMPEYNRISAIYM